jgi:inner membrane protein oxaA
MEQIATIIGAMLNLIYSLVGNFGFSIIILSLIVKLLLFPLEIKGRITNIKTSKLTEKQKKLQEKYKNNQQAFNQAMLDLYKEEGMSPLAPLGGCLMVIIQLMVMIGIIIVVMSPLKYIKGMTSEQIDSKYSQIVEQRVSKLTSEGKSEEDAKKEAQKDIRQKEMVIIKELGSTDESVKINMEFLGLDLTSIPSETIKSINDLKEPKNIGIISIPLLYIIMSFISYGVAQKDMEHIREQSKTNKDDKVVKVVEDTKNEKDKKEDDDKFTSEDFQDAMMTSNKMMKYILPLMIFSVSMVTSLGISIYWAFNSMVDIGKTYLLKNIVNKKLNNDAKGKV